MKKKIIGIILVVIVLIIIAIFLINKPENKRLGKIDNVKNITRIKDAEGILEKHISIQLKL